MLDNWIAHVTDEESMWLFNGSKWQNSNLENNGPKVKFT